MSKEREDVEGGVGDVEEAGETTAAAAIKGPEDTRPVGTGTLAEVEPPKDSPDGHKES